MTVDKIINQLYEINIPYGALNKAIDLIKQQQAEIEKLKADNVIIDAKYEGAISACAYYSKELEKLKANQPVKCWECQYYHYHYKNGASCDLCNKELLQADDYCSYGKRKESEG